MSTNVNKGDSDVNPDEALRRVKAAQQLAKPETVAASTQKPFVKKPFFINECIEAGNSHADANPKDTSMRHLDRNVAVPE